MSTAFVAQLRTSRPPIKLVEPGKGTITVRVEASDLWEAVRVFARPDIPASELKRRVVAELFQKGEYVDDFVLKLRGWEMLDERLPLSECGVVDGSILLIAYRRRRPVR